MNTTMGKERIIALDVGDRRIGIAVSDPLGLTAQPIETYSRIGYGPDIRHIRALAEQYETKGILCGLPRNMDGTEGFQAEKVREFAGKLEEAGLRVFFYDERMTTMQAESALIEGGLHRDDRKKKVDMVAAVMILQSYLDTEAQKASRLQEDVLEPTEDDDNGFDEDIWTFDDEDGNPLEFRLVYDLLMDGVHYLLFNDTADSGLDTDFIVMTEKKEDGETVYESVEDENLLQHIYEQYIRNSDQ